MTGVAFPELIKAFMIMGGIAGVVMILAVPASIFIGLYHNHQDKTQTRKLRDMAMQSKVNSDAVSSWKESGVDPDTAMLLSNQLHGKVAETATAKHNIGTWVKTALLAIIAIALIANFFHF